MRPPPPPLAAPSTGAEWRQCGLPSYHKGRVGEIVKDFRLVLGMALPGPDFLQGFLHPQDGVVEVASIVGDSTKIKTVLL